MSTPDNLRQILGRETLRFMPSSDDCESGVLTVLVDEWLGTCRPAFEKSSATAYRKRLRQFVKETGVRLVGDFDAEPCSVWVYERGLRPASQRCRWNSLRSFSKWLYGEGHLQFDVMLEVDGPRVPRRVPRPLSSSQASAVLASARRRDAAPQAARGASNELMASLMLQEGLRCVEVRRLECADVDLERGTVWVQGKGGNERTLPLSDQTRSVLMRHLGAAEWVSGPLLRMRYTFEALTESSINQRMARIFEGAGVKRAAYDGMSAHGLRATAATDVYEKTLDIQVVKEMLGHEHLSSTQHYVGLASPERLRAAMSGRRY